MVNQIEGSPMARKAKPLVIRIEGLSDMGNAIVEPEPQTFKDDFSPELIPIVQPVVVPQRIAPDHRKLAREAAIQAKTEQLSLLVRLGLVDVVDPIPPGPHLAHNQRLIGDKVWTFTNPNAMK